MAAIERRASNRRSKKRSNPLLALSKDEKEGLGNVFLVSVGKRVQKADTEEVPRPYS